MFDLMPLSPLRVAPSAKWMAPRASTVPPRRTRTSSGLPGLREKRETSWPIRVEGRNESLLIQILPSSPMLRTCMRILSAWPTTITVRRSSSPGCVSRTIDALPANFRMPQPSSLIFSKYGSSTPKVIEAS